MTRKDIDNELGWWGDSIREYPNIYAYIRQHCSNDVCDLKPITYEVLWSLLLHSEMNDLYFYNENHAIDETCVFYEFYNDLGFELPEDRDLDMSDYPHVCIELSDENGYEGDVDIFMLEEWPVSEDMTDEDKERFDTIRKKSPITLGDFDPHDLHTLFDKVVRK